MIKIKKIIIPIFLLCISITTIYASTTYPNDYPGGKNYLDPNNFIYDGDSIEMNDYIKVKENTMYTLSFPGDGEFSIDNLLVESDIVILSGAVWDLDECTASMEQVICTFLVPSGMTELSIFLSGRYLGDYIANYGMYLFQLEEGSVNTEYEGYIEPGDTTEPVITGSGTYIKSYELNTSIETIIESYITAYDDYDGDISDSIIVLSDNYSGNETRVGNYNVMLSVSDSSNNTAQFELDIIVKDDVVPDITGPVSLRTNVDSPITLEDIMNQITAYDEYDGTRTVSIDLDMYTPSKNTLGTYQIDFSATDSNNNKATHSVFITVEDLVAPSIASSSLIMTNASNPISVTEIVDNLNITDNYDNSDLISIEVISDNYTNDQTTVGNHQITVKLTDTSGNIKTEIITIAVQDDITPIVTGPNSLVLMYNEQKTLTELKNLFTVSDNYASLSSGDLVVLNDTYSTHENEVGDYYITFKATDTAGNETLKTINIRVIDNDLPSIYVDENVITVSYNALFDPNDLLVMLVKNNEIPDQDYDINILHDEYKGNESTPGSYAYKVELVGKDGQTFVKELIVKVVEPDTSSDLLLYRNILLYASSVAFIGFVVLKMTKKH